MPALTIFVMMIGLVLSSCQGLSNPETTLHFYESQPCVGTSNPVGTEVPAGLRPDTIVELGQVTSQSRALTLLRNSDGQLVGVVTLSKGEAVVMKKATASHSKNSVIFTGPIGPREMNSTLVDSGEQPILLMYRGELATTDASLMDRASAVHRVPAGYALVALQDPVQVPGIGSIPLSFGSNGWVASYTARDSVGEQRAIAVGEVLLCRSHNALDVFDWWFGHGSRDGNEYNDAAPSEAGNGSRRITAFISSQSLLSVVASFGLSTAEHRAAVTSKHPLIAAERSAFTI